MTLPDPRLDENEAARQSGRVKTFCISLICWLVSLIGAIVPGVFPIALHFTMRGGESSGSHALALRILGWTAGPTLGAGIGALLGLPFSSPTERFLRTTILGGSVGVLVSLLAGVVFQGLARRDHLDDWAIELSQIRLVFGMLLLGLLLGFGAGWPGLRFRLGTLLLAVAASGVLMNWALAPLRPERFMVLAEPALQAIERRAAEDAALEGVFPAEIRKVTVPAPYLYLRMSPRLKGDPASTTGAIVIAVGRGRYAAEQLAGTAETINSPDGARSQTSVWRVDQGDVGLYVRTKSDDPRAHRRLVSIVEQEFRRRGFRLEPK